MQKSIMQTSEWAHFKSLFGWRWHHIKNMYVLKRTLRFGYNFTYIPEILPFDIGIASHAADAIAALAQARDAKTIFGRAEFMIPYSEDAHHKLLQAGFTKARDEIQPAWRQVIDLGPTLAQIRAQMKPKGRYNTNLAEKKGVIVSQDSSDDAINAFLALHHATVSRKKIQGRGATYLESLIHMLQESGMGGLWVARYQGQILAGAVVTMWGDVASYLYGASSELDRSVMAPYALHFAIIAEAKRKGCRVYDMIGVAPPGAHRKHRWTGISRFKREFGGSTVHYLGSYDRVYQPMLYTAYALMRRKDT